MSTATQGSPVHLTLQTGDVLTVSADLISHGLVRRVSDSPDQQLQGRHEQDVPAGSTRAFGPFPAARRYSLETAVGTLDYSAAVFDIAFSTLRGNVEGFTGDLILKADDNGKLLRCDDASPVVLTVPDDLPAGFNIGIAMWGAGSVTMAGATNRSTVTALSTQYGLGSLIVLKNAGVAEFKLGGDFA
jgi:hypothetical protein